MRSPKVENKYNLDMKKIRKLKVVDRSKVCKPLFKRNDIVQAWYIAGAAGSKNDFKYSTNNSFWVGIYDEDAKAYAGKFRVDLSAYDGMCGYNFNKFFKEKTIKNENDLKIQEMFLETINKLIDIGVLGWTV